MEAPIRWDVHTVSREHDSAMLCSGVESRGGHGGTALPRRGGRAGLGRGMKRKSHGLHFRQGGDGKWLTKRAHIPGRYGLTCMRRAVAATVVKNSIPCPDRGTRVSVSKRQWRPILVPSPGRSARQWAELRRIPFQRV